MCSVQQHPDYTNEKERLAYTKDYIDSILDMASSYQGSYKNNIKEAFVNLDHLDSSLSYINILTNARLLEMVQSDLRSLKQVRNKPYFGRVDFTREGADHPEKYYIGKVSLYRKDNEEPIIIDWRSPLANIYYEGRLGVISYQSEDGEEKGHLELKRQYIIEEGELEEIRDIDITTRDELLQKSLAEKADKRLNDIVATIKAEQNKVIRADLQKPMIVQGVAGSGKTTIALHRLSYFIYTHADKVSPDKMMILAPNNMFIHYIAESLPELGVENIKQTTFRDYVFECLGKRLKMTDANEKLKQLIDPEIENKASLEWISALKGSSRFETILKRYMKDIRNHYVPDEDIYIGNFHLYSAKRLRKRFVKDYQYLPFRSRQNKIEDLLKKNFQNGKKKILQAIEENFEQKYDAINSKYSDPEVRRKKMVQLVENKEKRTDEVKSQTKRIITDYMKKFPKKKTVDYYQELMTNAELLRKYAGDDLSEEQLTILTTHAQQTVQKNLFDIEDLAPLLYIQTYLNGIPDDLKMKNIVIDEGQDYSLFQIRALRKANGTNLFTILGDLSQGIHEYRGTRDWNTIIEQALPKANHLSLQKSYRTTIEIMTLANSILAKLDHDLPAAEPVVRHGGKPIFQAVDSKKAATAVLTGQLRQLKKDYTSIAIIGKTEKECRWIHRELNRHPELTVQLLEANDDIDSNIVVIPSYVAMTRGMHRLHLIGKSPEAFHIGEEEFELIDSTSSSAD